MNIKLNNFMVIYYDPFNDHHYQNATQISKDSTIVKYLGKTNPKEWNRSYLQNFVFYLIEYKQQCIGVLAIDSYKQETKVITTLVYGLLEQYQDKGLGSMFLEQLSTHLIDDQEVQEIRLFIDKENIPSICIARKNGFQKKENSSCYVKQKILIKK